MIILLALPYFHTFVISKRFKVLNFNFNIELTLLHCATLLTLTHPISQVRSQHQERTIEFIVDELGLMTRKETSERIFFISAKEVSINSYLFLLCSYQIVF